MQLVHVLERVVDVAGHHDRDQRGVPVLGDGGRVLRLVVGRDALDHVGPKGADPGREVADVGLEGGVVDGRGVGAHDHEVGDLPRPGHALLEQLLPGQAVGLGGAELHVRGDPGAEQLPDGDHREDDEDGPQADGAPRVQRAGAGEALGETPARPPRGLRGLLLRVRSHDGPPGSLVFSPPLRGGALSSRVADDGPPWLVRSAARHHVGRVDHADVGVGPRGEGRVPRVRPWPEDDDRARRGSEARKAGDSAGRRLATTSVPGDDHEVRRARRRDHPLQRAAVAGLADDLHPEALQR